MLITDEYRALNAQMHTDDAAWGRQAVQNAANVQNVANHIGVRKFLDYGCGKQMLKVVLEPVGFEVVCYDPAYPELSTPPEPHDFVVCLDVLEHVEPECLDAVLKDLHRVTKDVLLVAVATRPSIKTLPDGSNCHRIIEPMAWWLEKFAPYFKAQVLSEKPGRVFAALLTPKTI